MEFAWMDELVSIWCRFHCHIRVQLRDELLGNNASCTCHSCSPHLWSTSPRPVNLEWRQGRRSSRRTNTTKSEKLSPSFKKNLEWPFLDQKTEKYLTRIYERINLKSTVSGWSSCDQDLTQVSFILCDVVRKVRVRGVGLWLQTIPRMNLQTDMTKSQTPFSRSLICHAQSLPLLGKSFDRLWL